MEIINQLESKVAEWLKPVPHLPANATKWLSENVWWLTLVGVILSVIGLISMIVGVFTVMALVGTVTSFYGINYSTVAYSWWNVITSLVSVIFMAATIALSAMAISPLKLSLKKGWTLLFLVLVLRAAAVVVEAILHFNVFGFISTIIFGAISIALGAYLLYEIRSHFVKVEKVAAAAKSAK